MLPSAIRTLRPTVKQLTVSLSPLVTETVTRTGLPGSRAARSASSMRTKKRFPASTLATWSSSADMFVPTFSNAAIARL